MARNLMDTTLGDPGYARRYLHMKFTFTAILLCASFALQADANDLALIFQHGTAGPVEYASWVDDDHVVFFSNHKVTCLSTDSGRVQWVVKDVGDITDWSVSRATKRLAYLEDTGEFMNSKLINVIDCNSGRKTFTADRNRISRLLKLKFAIPSRIALAPDDGRLLVCMFSTFYGRNAYVLDPSHTKVQTSFQIDASPKEVSISPNGKRVSIIADDEVLCIRDLLNNRDVFFRGTRIKEKPDSIVGTIDGPFFSHFRDSGDDLLVYTLDNSWATGWVYVYNLKSRRASSFDAHNGHIELDVSFETKRIAVTGTSTDLTLLDFDGNVLSSKSDATMQRNLCVEFSPSTDRILVGSCDNTLSVCSIAGSSK